MNEHELIHAYGIKRLCPCREAVRIKHDAEPCLPTVEVVKAHHDFENDPRPVLTRLPRLTVVGRP